MNKPTRLLSALLALSLSGVGALAQDRRDERRDDRRDDNRGRVEQRRDEHANNWNDRGAGPDHRFHKGDRLPQEYRTNHYVVDDWRGHHLSAPPRGYHWVQSGGDYLLVAVATGVILNALLNN